ncbi:MAG: monovalent cation/H+ antiporter complex subunit F [Bacteroidales bacterium]
MEHSVLEISVFVAFGLLLLAFVFALYRLFRGPSSSDQIVALDLIASIVMGFILLYSLLVDREIYFDIAIVIAMISFLGTIGISIYLKRKS